MGGIFGDTPCDSINRKVCPLSVPFVPPIKTPKTEPPSNRHLDATEKPTTLQSSTRPQKEPWAGLGWADLGWAWLGAKNEAPLKTAKRSGTAAPNEPKMDQKRSVTAAENGTSESGKKRLWQSFAYAYTMVWAGLGWAEAGQTQLGGRGCGLGRVRAGLAWVGWAGLHMLGYLAWALG